MASIRFEWDPRKAAANLRKHGITFVEAETAFYDDYAAVSEDPDHSEDRNERRPAGPPGRPRRAGGGISRPIDIRAKSDPV